jgi:uncharacterized membrane protein
MSSSDVKPKNGSSSRPTKPARFVSPRTVALYGILTALTTAITYASYTPFSPTKGYFNLGDSMVFFSAFAFGCRAGLICGGIGSAVADVLLGSGIYAPITLVAKGSEGFVAGILGRRKPSVIWVILTGAYLAVLTALLSLKVHWPDPWDVLSEWYLPIAVLLITMSSVYVVAFAFRERFFQWTPFILGIAVGGTCMVTAYFLGEYFLLGVGLGKALLEVPVNVGQVLLGGLIGTLLSYYVSKSYPRISGQ